MKPIRIITIISLTLLSFWGYTQGEESDMDLLEFYRQMALSDAEMEESLTFSSADDEADYWRDQLYFEKQLKQKEYSAYKSYIFFKRKAYLEHQGECDITANHGKGYNRQAFFYATQGNLGMTGTISVSGDVGDPAFLASQRH